MKNFNNWNEIQEVTTFELMPAGAYVGVICGVEDKTQWEFLSLDIDVAEGQFAGSFRKVFEQHNFWGLQGTMSYKATAEKFFKKNISDIEKQNPNYNFQATNFNENTLVGKRVGIVVGHKEYQGNDGKIKTKCVVSQFISIDDLRAGKFTVPEKQCLANNFSAVTQTTTNDFNITENDLQF